MKPLTAALIAVQQNADLLKGEKGDPGRDGDPGVEGKAAVDGLTWRGTFAYGTTYQPGDVVEWEGSSYVALVVTARRPPDPEWDLLAAKGEAGASGRGYIRGGGGSGSGSALTIKDEGSSLTAAAASIDFAGAGVTATAVGTAVTVTIPAGGVSDHGALTGLADDDHPQYLTEAEADALYAPTGDYIPQGGPLTADLDPGGFSIVGATGAPDDFGADVQLFGGEGGATTGGGGSVVVAGGNGQTGAEGGALDLRGGVGDGGSTTGARVIVAGGDATDPGRLTLRTDNDTGSSGDVFTAQGDGTALWAPGGIPQGGPLTEDLLAGGFALKGADAGGTGGRLATEDAGGDDGGTVVFTGGTSADGNDGGSLFAGGGEDGAQGGDVDLSGGNAAAGLPGGTAALAAGQGDDGNDPQAYFRAYGGDGAGNAGRVEIQTDDSTGSSGDLLTAQGDGTALWVPPAASGLTQAQVFARMTGA